MSPLRAFMVKEVRHILRDRQTLWILLLLPLAQVILFGFALRTDVRGVRVAFVAPAPDQATRALRARLAHNGRMRIVADAATTDVLEPMFQRGELDVAVVAEPGLAERLGRGETGHLLVIADAADPNTGTTMQNYVAAVVALPPRIEMRVRMRFNPTLESVNLFVPGLIALIITLVTTLMTSISLAREKERGTLEVLLVSPLRPRHVIAGKVLPYLGLALVNVGTALLAAWLVFGVPFRGSLTLLLAASMVYALVGLALGVLIAAVTTSQVAAMLAALGGTMMPNVLLSGMIFPITSLPAWLQPVTNLIPARWFIEISRGVMLKGVGLAHLWEELLILTVMFVVLLVAAVRRFSVRLA